MKFLIAPLTMLTSTHKKILNIFATFSVLAFASQFAHAGSVNAGNLEFEIATMITTGEYEEIVRPQETYCVQAVLSPEISSNWPYIGDFPKNSTYTRRLDNGPLGIRTCTVPAIIKTSSGFTLRLYRDVKTQLVVTEKRLKTQGGLGVFGALLNTVTLGLSNSLFSVVDNGTAQTEFATNLQTTFAYAVSQKVPEPVLQNDLITLQCQIEAAQLARQACADATLIDQNEYYNSLRQTYLSFMTKYRTPVKSKK
jgi:hypothetical protein